MDGRFASAETGGLSDCGFRVLFCNDKDRWLEGLSARKPPEMGVVALGFTHLKSAAKNAASKNSCAQITRQIRLSNLNATNLQQLRRHGRVRLQPSQLNHSRTLLEMDHDVGRWHFALRC